MFKFLKERLKKSVEDVSEKIEKEEGKIEGLEELFNELASTKKKKKEKKKVLLVEPEKEIVPQVSTEELVTELEQLAVVEETIEESKEPESDNKPNNEIDDEDKEEASD